MCLITEYFVSRWSVKSALYFCDIDPGRNINLLSWDGGLYSYNVETGSLTIDSSRGYCVTGNLQVFSYP